MFLSELKKGKNIFLVLLLILLITIPLYSHVYYMSLYYIIVILMGIPLTYFRIMRSDFLEMRFYCKWGKKRKKGRLFHIFTESFRSILLIIAFVFSGQFIVNGRTPGFILSELPINLSIGLMFFLFILGAIVGIVAWYENEKRFHENSLKLETKK